MTRAWFCSWSVKMNAEPDGDELVVHHPHLSGHTAKEALRVWIEKFD